MSLKSSSLSKFPPIRNWIFKYDFRNDIVYDILSGITVGVMAIPQSMGYALLAGLPPQYGLYSDLQVCYPILGTSKYLIVGPVAVMSLMARASMERLDDASIAPMSTNWVNLVCLLSVFVSMIQLLIGYLKLGSRIMTLLPETAIAGFSSAAALIIGSTQLPGLFGLTKCKSATGQSCGFFGTLIYTASNIGSANLPSLLCGFLSVVVLVFFKFLPQRGVLPKLGPLAVVVLTVLFFHSTKNLDGKVVGDVDVVGFIPVGMPSPRIPSFPSDIATLVSLFLSAIPIALVGFAEASAIATTSTKLRGEDVSSISSDGEVIALGACNAFTAWVGGYPVTGSFSRTAINAESGAKSSLSTAVAAVAVVIVLMLFTPYLAMLPKSAVCAIVLSAVVRLVSLAPFVDLYNSYYKGVKNSQHDKNGALIFVSVFCIALVFGVEVGLLVGALLQQVFSNAKSAKKQPV